MERYGEKPKKFTAKWYGYIWEYYKIHIIVFLAIIAAVIYTWVAIASRTYYDLYICFAGDEMITQESKEKLKGELKEYIKDVNGDGEININILDYTISDSFDDIEYVSAMESKLYLELQAGDSYLYIMPEEKAAQLTNDSMLEGLFDESWQESGKNECFSKIEGSGVFAESGIVYNDLRIGIKNFTVRQGDEEDMAQRQNAIDAAKHILEK